VLQLDPDTRKATALPVDPNGNGLPEAAVVTLLTAQDGTLWFGTRAGGLAHWWPPSSGQASRWELFRHRASDADSLAHDHVLALGEDADGRIWIGTLDGLSVYDPAKRAMKTYRHNPDDPHSLTDNLVRVIHQSGDGAVWIGTQSGLDRVDLPGTVPLTFVSYDREKGLPRGAVYGILEDSHYNLWLSTNRGLARFDRATAVFRSFALKDGLQSMEFNAGAALRRANGELVFGGIHGLNIFDPELSHEESYAAPT